MEHSIADLRKEYSQQSLYENEVEADPLFQFKKWWDQVLAADVDEPNAMTLATASMDAVPSARIVLLKDFSEKGFVFFTNYESYKGKQLSENPKACLVFFWKKLERQVRITGLVFKLSSAESDEYFNSRPEASRIGAWTSPQSQVIESRTWLDEQFNKLYAEMKNGNIQRPPHWGGFIVKPVIIEFWQGRVSRLHDRIQYSLQENGTWKIERLAP
ncbi:MAG: pyridoxamine 5'-phosphate oxidase [Bacteroidetes bacterium]|nr:pyridoxamine 5'-phosphate oxidase [Bacteroidota bacterium]MBS1930921.1 pyridoxamine 5'-phosphate oxidase [Bacteroidota bacterium]